MAQSSIKSFFPTRKRPVVVDLKKVFDAPTSNVEHAAKRIRLSQKSPPAEDDADLKKIKKIEATPEATGTSSCVRVEQQSILEQRKEEEIILKTPEPAISNERPTTPDKAPSLEENITRDTPEPTNSSNSTNQEVGRPSTPDNSPSLEEKINEGLGLNDLKVKINRSKYYNALKDSLSRYQSRDARLKDIARRLQTNSSFEIEVPVSPVKSPLKPQKLFSSPIKTPQKGLGRRLDYTSPVKPNVYVSPRKLLEERPSPVKAVPCHLKFESLVNGDALILPFKYRSLFEIFCSVDTVSSLFHNRNEKITFSKLKAGVQEMLRRNFSESHLAQIKTVLPGAFEFSQEKYQVFGKRSEAVYHLIIRPVIKNRNGDLQEAQSSMTPTVLAARKREFSNCLLEITKRHHREFLLSLDPPLDIPTEKVTRWHAEFEVNAVPDIPQAELPVSPVQNNQLSAKDVLANAKSLLKANAKVTAAIENLSKRLEGQTEIESPRKPFPSFSVPCHSPKPTATGSAMDAVEAASKALKGVPQSLLNKIKAKQAARAVEAMTRSPAQNKKAVMLSRLPEIARVVRNLFVVERKSVLPLDQVTVKLEHSCREKLSPDEIRSHLSLIQDHAPEWLSMCLVRNANYVKLHRTADVEAVMLKLNKLVETEGRIYHCR
nr:PREDICTED: DNA replication factor Cdt1 isoform X2 [Bemisia tabaci]